MKKFVGVLALIAVVGCSSKEKIGLVDYDEISEEYTVLLDLQKDLELAETRFKSIGDSLQMAYQMEGQKLSDELKRLSRKKQEERSQEFQNKYMQAQQSFQRQYSQFQSMQQVKLDSIKGKIESTVELYGEENEFTLILKSGEQGSVLFGGEGLDITDEILERLNEKEKED
jgi:Skp family chaperone for outer membrane proteins